MDISVFLDDEKPESIEMQRLEPLPHMVAPKPSFLLQFRAVVREFYQFLSI